MPQEMMLTKIWKSDNVEKTTSVVDDIPGNHCEGRTCKQAFLLQLQVYRK